MVQYEKIHARRDVTSNFLGLATARQNVGDILHSSPHVFNPRLRCRPDARFVDLLTDGMVDFV